MKQILDFILQYPRRVLVSLILVSLICIAGITLLQFENSYEISMPEGDRSFLLGEEIKKEFKDSETYLLISIEPAPGKRLLSHEVFSHLNYMVNEIKEYRSFNKEREDRRLESLIRLASITITPGDGTLHDEDEKPASSEFVQPIRKRNKYNYQTYKPVSLDEIKAALDPVARNQLATILQAQLIDIKDEQQRLVAEQYEKILEAWEDLYLFKSMEIIEVFSNPIEIADISGVNDTLRMVQLIKKDPEGNRIIPSTEKEFSRYKKVLFHNPVFKWNYYSQDAKGEIIGLASSIMLRRQKNYDSFMRYLWPMVHKYNEGPVRMLMQGGLVFDKFINEFNQRDLEFYVPMVLLIIIATFFLNFRTIRGVLLPTFTVIISTIITLGIMGFCGVKMTMVSTILPPLMIAIGSSYSIHIFNQYLIDLEIIHREGKKQGLKRTMLHISNTVFLTGLTTFISFLTLVVNRIPALSEFGYIAALGTAISVVVSVVLIVSVLYLLKMLPYHIDAKKGKERRPNALVMSIVQICSRLSVKHYRGVMLFTAASIIVSTIGMTRMTTETSATSYFKPDSYIRISLDKTNDLFRGTYIVNLVFSPGKGKSVMDADFLNYLEEVREWLSRPGQDTEYRILYNSGFGDYVKRMNMAMNNEDPGYYSIPDTMTINDYMEIFGGDDDNFDGRPDVFEPYLNPDDDKTILMVRIGTLGGELMTTKKTQATLDHITAYLDSRPNPGGYSYIVVGGPTNFITVSDYIVRGQIKTIIMSLGIIGIVMLLLFRNPAAGIVSLIPVSCTVLWVFGFMGFYGIPLGMAQALISSVAIGIGIDDTVHFMNTLRKNLSKGLELKEAVSATHREAGLAIVYTSVAIVFGFSVLMHSHFTPIMESGMLVTGVMVTSTFADLIILPSIILFFNLRIHEVHDWKIFRLLKIHRLLIQYTPENERSVAN